MKTPQFVTLSLPKMLSVANTFKISELWYARTPSGSHLTEMLALICSAYDGRGRIPHSENRAIDREGFFREQKELARPERLELSTLRLEAVRSTLPNLARGVANRTDSASWGKFPQPAFSFLYCYLLHFCRRFLQFALHFRDSIAIAVIDHAKA
jgi:hypothetical protein